MKAEVLQLLQCLTAEHIALHEWRRTAEDHFRDGDTLDIGDGPALMGMRSFDIPPFGIVLFLYPHCHSTLGCQSVCSSLRTESQSHPVWQLQGPSARSLPGRTTTE